MIWVSLPSVHWSPICISKIYKELTQLNNKKQPKQKMGRRPKYTFLQRHKDSQKAHEKMLNITDYQRNANQNYSEISPHTSQNGYHQKSTKTKGWRD